MLTAGPAGSSAPVSPSLSQQLTTCTDDIDYLIAGLGTALGNVTALSLHVISRKGKLTQAQAVTTPDDQVANALEQQQQHGEEQQQQEQLFEEKDYLAMLAALADGDDAFKPTFMLVGPGEGEVAPSSVFSMLAAAVPCLRSLTLSGCCWDALLPAFGASCRQVEELHVSIKHIPFSALKGLGHHLPSLRFLGILSDSRGDQFLVAKYMDALMVEMQDCKQLYRLKLRFYETRCWDSTTNGSISLTCKAESWSHLPKSLREFDCNSRIRSSGQYTTFIQGMRSLTLQEAPCDELAQVLVDFPLLEHLLVNGAEMPGWHFTCPNDAVGMSSLRMRIGAVSFNLDYNQLTLKGTGTRIAEVFDCMPQVISAVIRNHSFLRGSSP